MKQINLSKFTHEEKIFILSVGLAGNLRKIEYLATQEEWRQDKDDIKTAYDNSNDLFIALVQTVTEEDWNKVRAMVAERCPEEWAAEQEEPLDDDPFRAFGA